MQRRRGAAVHVRPVAQVNTHLSQELSATHTLQLLCSPLSSIQLPVCSPLLSLSLCPSCPPLCSGYKQARLLNKTATPFLIGTKYDYFSSLKAEEKADVTSQARRFARAMKAPLIFCSSSHAINIHKIFKVVLAKVFDLKCSVEQITRVGDPIIEFDLDDQGNPRQQPQAGEEGEGSERGKSGTQTPEEKAAA